MLFNACVTPVLTFAEAAADAHMTARGTVSVIDNVMQASVSARFSRTVPDLAFQMAPLARPPIRTKCRTTDPSRSGALRALKR